MEFIASVPEGDDAAKQRATELVEENIFQIAAVLTGTQRLQAKFLDSIERSRERSVR